MELSTGYSLCCTGFSISSRLWSYPTPNWAGSGLGGMGNDHLEFGMVSYLTYRFSARYLLSRPAPCCPSSDWYCATAKELSAIHFFIPNGLNDLGLRAHCIQCHRTAEYIQ